MDHGFKLRFDQMRENSPAGSNEKQATGESPEDAFHPPGHARNLCLVWPDGKRAFFNYAYLVAAEFLPGEEMNIIRLEFSSHQVVLKGYGLEELFKQLADHLPRVVEAVEQRYATERRNEESILVEAQVIALHASKINNT